MIIRQTLKVALPETAKQPIRKALEYLTGKHDAELSYWSSRLEMDGGRFKNHHYERLMLAMAEEDSDAFLQDKVVADFGCGPRGSLAWANAAFMRFGIDVIADRYADEFTNDVLNHGMAYVKCTEKAIPLPSDFVDVMFTMNAIDHVNDFAVMCNEILRVLKPGGLFIGSFNLEEPASPHEPQRLTEQCIKDNLLNQLEIQSYRLAEQEPDDETGELGGNYAPFFKDELSYRMGHEGFLWVRAKKPV